MRRKSINGIMAIIAFVLVHLTTNVSAQTDVSRFKEAIKKDSTLIYGLAGYDAAVRDDILTVARHPEVLTRLVEMKNISASSFKSLIENLDRDTQFGIYELSRYPDLVKELTIQGKLKKTDVENIILSYPEDIHEAALNYGRKQYKVLASIDRMNDKNKQDFETLIGKYDSNFQASMQRLIETPEVLLIPALSLLLFHYAILQV